MFYVAEAILLVMISLVRAGLREEIGILQASAAAKFRQAQELKGKIIKPGDRISDKVEKLFESSALDAAAAEKLRDQLQQQTQRQVTFFSFMRRIVALRTSFVSHLHLLALRKLPALSCLLGAKFCRMCCGSTTTSCWRCGGNRAAH